MATTIVLWLIAAYAFFAHVTLSTGPAAAEGKPAQTAVAISNAVLRIAYLALSALCVWWAR